MSAIGEFGSIIDCLVFLVETLSQMGRDANLFCVCSLSCEKNGKGGEDLPN